MAYSLGIDLGTTYSAAATARDGRLEIFQLGERAATIPSIVVLRADGEVLTGDAAERRSLGEPTRTAREFKRRLGDPTPIILGGTPYGAEALLAHLLRGIVARVTEQSGGAPAAIVVSHPASYGAYKIDLLEQAVRQADVADVTLLTEPEAAAVHYAQQERVPAGAVIAVYDFGGGTFDATILRKTEDGFEQLGRPEGMERLGGIDFDEALFTRAMSLVRSSGVALDANDPATLAAIARLREECRRAKEALSSDTDATIQIVLPGLQTEMRLTREEFEEMIRPRITETIEALGRAARSAGLGFDGIDRILLVGGSSRIPLVAEMVREATGTPDRGRRASQALDGARGGVRRRRAPARRRPRRRAGRRRRRRPGRSSRAPPSPETAVDAARGRGGCRGGRRCRGRGDGAPTGRRRRPADAAAPVAGRARSTRAAAPGRATVAATAAAGRPGRRRRGRSGRSRTIAAAAVDRCHRPRSPCSRSGRRGCSRAPRRRRARRPRSRWRSPSAARRPPSLAPRPRSPPWTRRRTDPTPTPTPTPTPAGRQARITAITISGGRYVVDYQVFGYKQELPGKPRPLLLRHGPAQGGRVPDEGPWIVYAKPVPFTRYKVSDRPAAANQMCILVANPDHSIVQNTGNCMDLP